MKVMKCKTADELMAMAKAAVFDITKVEAEAYMAERLTLNWTASS